MWYPTIIRNVDLNIDRAAIIAKFGADAKDAARLHIRYEMKDGEKIIAEKRYLLPKEWENQTNDLLETSLTFTDGQNFDFFYVGEWKNKLPVMDEDYDSSLGFYSYMNKNHDQVFAISSVAEYSLIPHFEIMAK